MTTKIKTLPILVGILMLFVGACNTDDDLLVNNPQPTRTLTLTASMPNDDNPTTRIALEKNDDLSIALTWQDGDKLQLLFVQNGFIKKAIATVKNITENGKRAQFDIDFPSEMTDDNFTLYGVYGGGGLDDANPATVLLPANPGSATSLADVQTKKHVMLYFQSTDIDAANPAISVTFQHLGALFNITLKNKATTHLNNIKEVRLAGVDGDGKWAYNHNQGAQTYNLLTGEFENRGTAGNYLSFAAPNNTLASEEEIAFWGWYPPLPNKHWPALKLELWNETTATHTTVNSKQARDNDIPAGKAYYFYAVWDGTKVSFTDSSFTPEYYIEEGGLDAALGEEKDNIDAMALKGTVNSADFEVMKSMASLRHLDLSGVTITGNKIPNYAFGAAPPPEMGAKNSAPNASNTIKKSDTDATHTANTTIETVVLPDNITAIGNYAFAQCINLKGNVTIPNSVISIGDGAFENCNKLDGTLILPESLETIGARAFQFCKFNSQLILPSNLVSIGEEAFNWCNKLYGDLTIPNTVTWIGKSAFADCSHMEGNLTLSSGITSIEDHTFNGTSFTGSLIIPEGVTSIGEAAFNGIYGFDGTFSLPQSLETIGSHAFWGSGNFEGNLVIPNKVTVIEDNTFAYTTFSGTLTLSENLKTIGKNAFQHSSNFVGTLEIPEGVTLIDDFAFQGCANSQSMPFGAKPQFIIDEPGGFDSLILPESLITIGRYAFHECSGFEGNLYLSDNITSIGASAFENCAGFTGNIQLPAQLQVVSSSAFAGCSGFNGTLTLPTTLTTIESWAFAGCENLTGTLSFPATLTTIEYNAFEDCNSFTGELIIPTTLNEVPSGAFAGCDGFTKLTLHEGITAIGENAFIYCTGLEGKLNLPSNLTHIGAFAFHECSNITDVVVFPITLESIGEEAFNGCGGVSAFRFPHTTPIPYENEMLPTESTIEVPTDAVDIYKTNAGWAAHTIVGY